MSDAGHAATTVVQDQMMDLAAMVIQQPVRSSTKRSVTLREDPPVPRAWRRE
jgi:hypothetical protein